MNELPELKNNRLLRFHIAFVKHEKKKFKDMSDHYMDLVFKCERRFECAVKGRPNLNMLSVLKNQALFEVPLLKVKDALDFMVGFLDGMLPAFEKDYHPQEPDRDPLFDIKQKFR